MKKITLLVVLLICLSAITIQSNIPTPSTEEFFIVRHGRQDLLPIIWQEEKNGKNYLFAVGFAKMSDQSTENCDNLPPAECLRYKAGKAAFFDAKAKLERFYTGPKFFQNFDLAEEGKIVDNEYVYIIGKVIIPNSPMPNLPKWLKVGEKTPLLLEGKDEYFSLGIIATDTTLKPRKRLSKAIKLAKEQSKFQLANFFQLKKVRGWCVEDQTYLDERNAKSAFVLGSMPKSKKN